MANLNWEIFEALYIAELFSQSYFSKLVEAGLNDLTRNL